MSDRGTVHPLPMDTGSRSSLAFASYDIAGGNPERALLLALDFLAAHGRVWRGEDERAEEAA